MNDFVRVGISIKKNKDEMQNNWVKLENKNEKKNAFENKNILAKNICFKHLKLKGKKLKNLKEFYSKHSRRRMVN